MVVEVQREVALVGPVGSGEFLELSLGGAAAQAWGEIHLASHL